MQGCILKHGYCKLSLDSLRRGESILRGGQLRCDTHGALVLLLLLQNTGIEQLKEESVCFVLELWVSVYHGEKGAAVDPQCDWSHCTQTGSREMNSYTQLSFCFSFFLFVQSAIMAPNFRVGVLHLHTEMYLLGVSQSSQIKKAKYPPHMVTLGEVFFF